MNGTEARRLNVSVIIPTWNDADDLAISLGELSRIRPRPQTIVVAAGTVAASEKSAREFGAIFLNAERPNRGAQMNRGAAVATGDVLVFNHADSRLTQPHFDAIDRALADQEIIGGAFHRKFDDRHPHLRMLDRIARFRGRHSAIFFGDQSIFVRRRVFERLGGFASIPLMEDVEFSRRLRAAGSLAIIDPAIESSPRRHLKRGPWRTTFENGLLLAIYKVGVRPERLHAWYYAGNGKRRV